MSEHLTDQDLKEGQRLDVFELPEFAPKFNLDGEDPFMAGMVHDIGKQVLGHFFNEMFQMVLGELKPGTTMFQVEA